MKYVNADVVLPQQLLQEIQKYMQGGMLYIPKPEGQHKRWGENSGGRSYLSARNQSIREHYASGLSVTEPGGAILPVSRQHQEDCVWKQAEKVEI